MTTPAVNINQVETRPGYKTVTNWVIPGGDFPPVKSLFANVSCYWFKKSRPASSSNSISSTDWRPCSSWSHLGYSWSYPPGTVHRDIDNHTSGTRNVYEGGSFWGVNPPVSIPTVPNGLINQAEVKALNKLKDQDINLGEFLAEADETIRMIAKNVASIARSVRRWRSSNKPLAWKLVRAYERFGNTSLDRSKIPQSWLELQYGWKPLMDDIVGGINFLTRKPRDPLIHVKGYAHHEEEVRTIVSSLADSSTAALSHKVVHQCWVGLYFKLNSPGLATTSSLGLLNPGEIVWECLPYSFVVDWVIPIGPWLSSLTADAGFTFFGGSRGLMSTIGDGKQERVTWASSPTVRVYGDGPSLRGKGFRFNRSCYTSSPVPGIYVKNPLSAAHVANATALLVEAFRN